jgi:hypothetical protein
MKNALRVAGFGFLAVALAACTITVPAGTNTGSPSSPGVTPPVVQPSTTPPVAADVNIYPYTMPADYNGGLFERGTGPDRLEIDLTNNPASGPNTNSVAIGVNGNIVVAPWLVKSVQGMGIVGDDQIVLHGVFGKTPKVDFISIAPYGISGLWVNAVNENYAPLVTNSCVNSRGGCMVNGLQVFISNGQNFSFGAAVATAPPGPVYQPQLVKGASIDGVTHDDALLETLITAVPQGGTLTVPAGTYHESFGITKPMTLEGGGKVVNAGQKNATYTAGAVLDAKGVSSYVQGQGGIVPLASSTVRGWEVTGFGMQAAAHDGTGGVRNNSPGDFRLEEMYLHGNQMGLGPHGGDATVWHIRNVLSIDNGMPNDPGYAHNFYFDGDEVDVEGGVTSIEHPNKGDGHALKSRAHKISIDGTNYFSAYNTSVVDIPNGTVEPINFGPGTTLEKVAGDENRVIFGYGLEGPTVGNTGGVIHGWTFIVPNDGQNYYIITSATITLDGCKFLYTDGSPVKAGTIVAQGPVLGLP